MNRQQRNSNRANAERLAQAARHARLMAHTCENCGEPGGHWITTRGTSLEALLTGRDDQEGFWTCPKLYGEDGRRLPEHTDHDIVAGLDAVLEDVVAFMALGRSNVKDEAPARRDGRPRSAG